MEVFDKLKDIEFEHKDEEGLILLWSSEYHRFQRDREAEIIEESDYNIAIKKLKLRLLEFIKKHKL